MPPVATEFAAGKGPCIAPSQEVPRTAAGHIFSQVIPCRITCWMSVADADPGEVWDLAALTDAGDLRIPPRRNGK